MTLWHGLSNGWFAALVDGGIVATVIGWAIQIAIYTYPTGWTSFLTMTISCLSLAPAMREFGTDPTKS